MNLVLGEVPATQWSAALAGLTAPLGVHAILGNHDYWEDLSFQRDPNGATIAETALSAIGVQVYVNRAARSRRMGVVSGSRGSATRWRCGPAKQFGRAQFAGIDDLPLTLAAIHTDDLCC